MNKYLPSLCIVLYNRNWNNNAGEKPENFHKIQ